MDHWGSGNEKGRHLSRKRACSQAMTTHLRRVDRVDSSSYPLPNFQKCITEIGRVGRLLVSTESSRHLKESLRPSALFLAKVFDSAESHSCVNKATLFLPQNLQRSQQCAGDVRVRLPICRSNSYRPARGFHAIASQALLAVEPGRDVNSLPTHVASRS